jgi:aspartate kinase
MQNQGVHIFKFGGASVKSADGVRNLVQILKNQSGNIVVVVSAMGKTTNSLEKILTSHLNKDENVWKQFDELKSYHYEIISDLANGYPSRQLNSVSDTFSLIYDFLKNNTSNDYNYCYDQLVSFGEILSTQIVFDHLARSGVQAQWVDARKAIVSDCNYREGNIDFAASKDKCLNAFNFSNSKLYVTQGFIAGTAKGTTATLGREGSDYTAALLANLLDADDVTIWKDVEGVLSADPRLFPNAVKLNEVSFKEAIELAYCGAQIIHPKTIKPLQNKGIPLYVKSFLNPQAEGSRIVPNAQREKLPPILVLKTNQVLISLSPKDYSFVIEDCLSRIFAIFYKHRVKVNLVQSSAISFSVCVDNEIHFLPGAMKELGEDFMVRFNENLSLLTVRHYTKATIDELTTDRVLFLQQLTRSTARFVMDSEK